MKKLIKISLLILFIIFVLGITTSNAASFTVTADTTASEMLQELNNGNILTGISGTIRDQNQYLLCREKEIPIYVNGEYKLDGSKITYPDDDATNGYARAYILAAPGYVKSDTIYSRVPTKEDERQYAWYCINGEISDGNDLYNIAIAYQNYKAKEEKDTKVTVGTEATSTVSGEKVVYGPIQIEYSYASAAGDSKSDEWGGFNYAFFDQNNNNISDNVKFCTLSNGVYTEVTSTKITSSDASNGYYKVRTSNYNKVNLYLVTEDKTINNVKIKIQENKVDYKSTLYALQGTVDLEAGYNLCNGCRQDAEEFQSSLDAAIAAGTSAKNSVLYNGVYYKYVGSTSKNYYSTTSGAYNQYNLGGITLTGSTSQSKYVGTIYRAPGQGWTHYKNVAQSNVISTYFVQTGNKFACKICGGSYYNSYKTSHANTHIETNSNGYYITSFIYNFQVYGCGKDLGPKAGSDCGKPFEAGEYSSQGLHLIDSIIEKKSNELKLDLEINLLTSIEVTKRWGDYNNYEGIRPSDITLTVYRSTDQKNWTKLTSGTDYEVIWTTKTGDNWRGTISNLRRVDDNGNEYYFKVVETTPNGYQVTYKSGDYTDGRVANVTNKAITITNNKLISIGGYVWLDGQTGIKPAVPNNGIMDDGETRLENITVRLYSRNPSLNTSTKIAETVTDKNGYYEFKNLSIAYYYVEFEYDGLHYENTIKVNNGSSKAFEVATTRNTFNGRFKTITYKKSNDGTTLNYNYSDGKSTLITNKEGTTKIANEFIMTAVTSQQFFYLSKVDNINLGLVKRGTDLAASTDVYTAKVTVNGQETNYTYNKEDNSIEIETTESSEKVSYNLNLYTSDYNYRVRDYITNDGFKENDYINEEVPSGLKTGEDLKVSIVYKLNLQNQSTKTTRINEVKYVYDEKYTFNGIVGNGYTVTDSGNAVVINLNGLEVKEGETKTLYLEFLVKEINDAVSQGNFSNKVEITSYSTDEGLIDIDSQPGNFITDNQVEDDSDTAGGLSIKTEDNFVRKITGKVFDEDGNNVNDVIVQLIELKTVDGKVYEYIWQETVSGTEKGLRLNGAGTALEEYSYTKADGYYEFKGFIPGDYIVRFIYGDGTTYTNVLYGDVNCDGTVDNYDLEMLRNYLAGSENGITEAGKINADMNQDEKIDTVDLAMLRQLVDLPDDFTGEVVTFYDSMKNVIKYNGQDYKSMPDANYNAEWYNLASYSEGASVARDNEARRLETMAYSVEIDASKGVLLKLLNNVTVDDLNETEKEILVSTYNNLYDPDITEVTTEVVNKLLKEQVLKNTWMCAETSKIKVAVDTENITNTTTSTTVNGTATSYVNNISNINFGLELRPATKIELKKYITGFKLVASNGQTLVNAYVDVNKYLDPTITDISNEVDGIKNYVTILDTVWQYEVVPTEINTVVDGASLEFEYTLVVENTGEDDYLSEELTNAYNTMSIADYKTLLTNKTTAIKGYIRSGTYNTQIGNAMGNNYYAGGTGATKVLTEVTNIRDYVNNDLTFVFSYEGKVDIDESAATPHTHRLLRDDYSMQEATIDTILKTTESTGKLSNTDNAVMYTVTLGKNPISSTGNLEFDTYIAEVMSYTNAAGRRIMYYEDGELKTATPGNAEIIDSEKRDGKSHEIDEADTGRIQIGVATGEDQQTNYIVIITAVAGIALIAAGAFVVKKYVIK